jgi:hypothetical protein
MSTANNSIPGMTYPTQKAMIGASPSDSARLAAVNKSASQAQANQLMAGGKIRKNKYRGGDGSIVVPQYQMLYEPQGGNGTNPNNQIQNGAQTSTQMAANSVYDKQATKMGGSKKNKSRRGGNPNWIWGCMSGGKKRTRKSHKKHTKRTRKTRKNRKH